jgi:hypothetical protein
MLAGAAIGQRVRPVWVAVPVAFFSHLLLDAIPHHELTEIPSLVPWSEFVNVFASLVAVGLVLVLAEPRPQRWAMIVCAVAGVALDPLDHAGPAWFQRWFDQSWLTGWIRPPHNWVQLPSVQVSLWFGFLTQALVIALALYLILAYRSPRREPPA